MSDKRQTVMIGKKNLLFDNSRQEMLHMALKKINAQTWGRPARREGSQEKWKAAFVFIFHLSYDNSLSFGTCIEK